MPLEKASANTAIKGKIKNSVRKAKATAINRNRTHNGSVVALFICADSRRSKEAIPAISAPGPPDAPILQQINQQQQNKRKNQQHHSKSGGAGIIILFQFGNN